MKKAYMMAWELKCKGITVYRYGSKPEQVLTIGGLEGGENEGDGFVKVGSEFAGGCPGGVCSETTT